MVVPTVVLVALLVKIIFNVHRRRDNLAHATTVGAWVNFILFALWVQDWVVSDYVEDHVAQNVFYAFAMIRRPIVATIVRGVVRWMVHVNGKHHAGLRQSEDVSRHMGVFMLQDLIDLLQILLVITLFPITFFGASPFMVLYFPLSIFVFLFNMISIAVAVSLLGTESDIENALRPPQESAPELVQ